MVTRDPSVRLLTLAQDGANTRSTLSQQMKRLPILEDPVLVVITVGSRDILSATDPDNTSDAITDADTFYETLTAICDEVGRRLADPVLFISNVPNPAQGEPPPLLAEINAAIADVAREQGASLIDMHEHFAGHVGDANDPAGEVWLSADLQPTSQGAHELRRLYWTALMNL